MSFWWFIGVLKQAFARLYLYCCLFDNSLLLAKKERVRAKHVRCCTHVLFTSKSALRYAPPLQAWTRNGIHIPLSWCVFLKFPLVLWSLLPGV